MTLHQISSLAKYKSIYEVAHIILTYIETDIFFVLSTIYHQLT